MNKSDILNNEKLLYTYNFRDFFLTKMYGLKWTTLKIFEKRLELFSNNIVANFNSAQYLALLNIFYNIIPNKKNLKDRKLLNIFFLDIINSYRGWRHSRGLPVRGQRTWTNAWTSYRSNLVLREYKIILAKRIYGNISTNELNVAYLAEQINMLWKLQWEQEWREAKKKRLVYLKKDINLYKVDLYSMSRGIVGGYTKKGEKSKKQKQTTRKNYFSLGFDSGFTKTLLKSSSSSSKKVGAQVNIITDSGDIKAKKKTLKKKVASSTTAKKKNKNDSWS